MKKAIKASCVLLVAIMFSGCAAEKQVPVPTKLMASESGQDLAVLERGHKVYMTQCTRCHEPLMPSEVSTEDWHIVTPGMAWNAGISEADETAVLKYILAAR